MTKKRKRRKNILHSTFYRVYFAVVIVCLIGIGIGAHWLNGLLADYETAQPSHVAEQAARLFENADYETIYDYDTSAQELADGDKDFYVQSMRELADGKSVRWSEGYSPDDDQRIYNVLLDDEKFAEIALTPSGRRTSHGNTLWQLSSITTNVKLGEQEAPVEEAPEEPVEEAPSGIPCHITVPSDYTVVVDGATLTAEDAAATGIPTVADGLLPDGVPNPTMTEYVVYSESGSPQIAVSDASGNPQTVSESGEYSWSCPLPDDAELKSKYEGSVVEVAKKIASCSAKTVSKDSVLKYCAKGSPAYAAISAFDASTGASKKPEKFENIASSNYYRYSEDCFSCHVTFDYLSKFTAKVIKTYPTTLTLYFVMQGDSGRLYSFTLY